MAQLLPYALSTSSPGPQPHPDSRPCAADNDNDVHHLRVVIVDAGSMLGVEAARGFLKYMQSSRPVSVTALVEDMNSSEARDLGSLGAKVITYTPTDPATIRAGLGKSGASTLVLIPPETNDLVTRTNNILSEAQHTIKSVYLWSSIGTDDAMSLPPDTGTGDSITPVDHPQPNALTLLKEAEELVMHALPESMDHIVLRSGFPLQSFLYLSNLIQNRGAIPFTSDTAHVAPIDVRDMGRVTCRLFHQSHGAIPDDRRGQIITLTGPESQSGPMIVTAANTGLPHPLAFAKVNMSDMRAFLLQTRISPFNLSLVLGWWQLFSDKRLDLVTPDLTDILFPDQLATISDFFADHVDQFLPHYTNTTVLERYPGDWEFMPRPSNYATMLAVWDAVLHTPSRLCSLITHDVNESTMSYVRGCVTSQVLRDVHASSSQSSSVGTSPSRFVQQVLRDVGNTKEQYHDHIYGDDGIASSLMVQQDIDGIDKLCKGSESHLVRAVLHDVSIESSEAIAVDDSRMNNWSACIIV